ncbi:bifunctional UDP-sugar hydrolase/5'-nucleotidase [Micromonospora sp. WMMD1120]|uniref:bifunctional metallophosphatase/5'-nucleotidase n=1 Tax=Micromonospora sp. WMMD1120 TaxID=3016106 RepID=UPI0024164C7E|nr:bifunctional UDP-sugar hydrolase/5'-nucleotidase [Micromonospora sp. WMMD1120]MDG4809442.1 bifunctional UDP-sugar hydrolase/5'-nucleotidase [Micromonospora sp. WMMD1120]
MRFLPVRAALATAAATLVVLGIAPAPAQAAETEVQILGFNDFHGRLEAPTAGVGGAAQMAGMIKQLRAANANTLLLSAGDSIGASPFISLVQQDAPTIDFLKTIGVDASSIGNHELDRGFDDLDDRVIPRAGFPHLAANVYRGAEPAPGRLEESTVLTIGGVRIGVVGAVTVETPSLVSPAGIRGLEFKDPTTEASRVAAKLRADGDVDAVVLLVHEGSEASGTDATACASVADPKTPFGKIVTGASADINVIISGHTHVPYNCAYDVAKLGHKRPVLQTGRYGDALDQIKLTITDGKVTAAEGAVLPIKGYPEDPAVAQFVADAKAEADVQGKVKIGEITADIKRAVTAEGVEDRGNESSLGNFIADVQLEATKAANRGGAQIALMNPGGLRADFVKRPDGTVTFADAATVQPFANDVITKSYTGKEIKAALEQQWQPTGASRPFLHLGVSKGFSYVYDPNGSAGNRVIADRIFLNGTVLDPNATYRVSVNSFLASGGDNFDALGDGADQFATGDNDLTVLVDYFTTKSPVTADTVERAYTVGQPGAPVAGGGPSGGPTGGPGNGGGAAGDPGLPITGAKVLTIVGAGIVLVLAGVVALLLARRRRIRLTVK